MNIYEFCSQNKLVLIQEYGPRKYIVVKIYNTGVPEDVPDEVLQMFVPVIGTGYSCEEAVANLVNAIRGKTLTVFSINSVYMSYRKVKVPEDLNA